MIIFIVVVVFLVGVKKYLYFVYESYDVFLLVVEDKNILDVIVLSE